VAGALQLDGDGERAEALDLLTDSVLLFVRKDIP
jgi:hypothetical protein